MLFHSNPKALNHKKSLTGLRLCKLTSRSSELWGERRMVPDKTLRLSSHDIESFHTSFLLLVAVLATRDPY